MPTNVYHRNTFSSLEQKAINKFLKASLKFSFILYSFLPEAVVDMKDNQAAVEEVEQNADDGVHKVEVVAAAVVEVVAVVVREE